MTALSEVGEFQLRAVLDSIPAGPVLSGIAEARGGARDLVDRPGGGACFALRLRPAGGERAAGERCQPPGGGATGSAAA